MKVIFIKDLKKQAKKGDIKEVKDGYAMNYLIKNGYAEKVTDVSINNFEKERKKEQDIIDTKRKEAMEEKEKLEKVTLLFKVKTGNQDKVFGSISAKQIKDELHKKGFKIEKRQIELLTSLSSLGYHNIKVNLFKEINATVKVQLVK